jgi:hypothetical protein
MSATPKASWPWVKTLLRSVYDQPDAASVHAQYDRLTDAKGAFSSPRSSGTPVPSKPPSTPSSLLLRTRPLEAVHVRGHLRPGPTRSMTTVEVPARNRGLDSRLDRRPARDPGRPRSAQRHRASRPPCPLPIRTKLAQVGLSSSLTSAQARRNRHRARAHRAAQPTARPKPRLTDASHSIAVTGMFNEHDVRCACRNLAHVMRLGDIC